MNDLPTDAISTAISFLQDEANGIIKEFKHLAYDQLQALVDENKRLATALLQGIIWHDCSHCAGHET